MGLLRRRSARGASRRVVPWLLILDLLRESRDHWNSQLTARERQRLTALLKESKGVPSRLGAREQRELKELASKLDLKQLGKRAAVTAAGAKLTGRGGRRRKRG